MGARESANVYLERVNRVIDHIDTHLDETLPLESLARVAHFSPFHFHRVFRSIVGEPLHAYVKRLRLERAVATMSHGPRIKLTDVALRCGFASSSDFSKAFKQAYGFSPSRYTPERFAEESKIRQALRANAGYNVSKLPPRQNPDRFRVRLVDRPAQRIAYVRVIGGYAPDKIMAGFETLIAWGKSRGLVPGAVLMAMSQDDPEITPMEKYRLDWCLALPLGTPADRQISCRTIPADRFATLHCRGDIHKVDRAWQYLFRGWLPESGMEPTNRPALEAFRNDPLVDGWESFDLDCCLPVKPLRR